MSENNIKLVIEYKGTNYSGWQSQVGVRTIQDEIENAVFKTTGKKVSLLAAGRTDAGVHALGQVANFRIDHDLAPEKYRDALNYYLDDDILIKTSELVSAKFHSRFDALSKHYRYLIGLEKSALYKDFRWEIDRQLDTSKLDKAAAMIIGSHDFTPFCVTSSRKEDNTCVIESSAWAVSDSVVEFNVTGNRFLHSMIRSLVGAMVNMAMIHNDTNKDNLTLESFDNIICSQTDERVKFTAPAHGLYLVEVKY